MNRSENICSINFYTSAIKNSLASEIPLIQNMEEQGVIDSKYILKIESMQKEYL